MMFMFYKKKRTTNPTTIKQHGYALHHVIQGGTELRLHQYVG